MKTLIKRSIASLILTSLLLSNATVFPIQEVFAETGKEKDEKLYASVLNEYVNEIIPGKANLFDDVTNDWKYCDTWMYSTKKLSDYGYVFHDLDHNGVDELFVLDCSYDTHVTEIYTIHNNSPQKIATGGARWNYYVVEADNVLGEWGSGGASVTGYTFYHLIDGKLVAFEKYINDTGVWRFASGDDCNKLEYDSMQIISESEVYSNMDTMGGNEMLVFDNDVYLFSDYTASNKNSSAPQSATNGRCGDNAYWDLDETTGTLTIRGTGDMYDYGIIGYEDNYAPWFVEWRDENGYFQADCKAKKVIIEEGITHIGACAFDGCSIENVSIANSVISIGNFAFHNCTLLKSIMIPKSVKDIATDSLGQCGNGGFGIVEGFTIYGYRGSAAEEYVKNINHSTTLDGKKWYNNTITFISLDDFEEKSEGEFTEEEKFISDFIRHHVGIANLNEEVNVFSCPDELSTLVELMQFDYFNGNTGISFATEAYANLGNTIEIVKAGQNSRDIFSTVSDTMYYEAILSLMYNSDEFKTLEDTKEYYVDTLKKVSEIFKAADMSYGEVTNYIPIISDTISAISKCESFADLSKTIENLDDSLKIFDLPLKNIKGENLSVGAGDVLSLISSAVEIKKNNNEEISNILNCVVYFRMFRDMQDNYKKILEQMYLNYSGDNDTYEQVLKNISYCITSPEIDIFILTYINDKSNVIKLETWSSICSVSLSTIAIKLAEILPGGKILGIMDLTGQVVDSLFDDMNRTEEKIASIGEMLCYSQIAASLEDIGKNYSNTLKNVNSFQNALAYHNIICLYYKSLYNCCKFGSIYMDSFISSYFSLDLDKNNSFGENAGIIVKDNIVFKYILINVENNLVDNDLNDIFELSNGDYKSWYKESIMLETSLRESRKIYKDNQAICCKRKTTEEIELIIGRFMESAIDKVKEYIKSNSSKWITTFIGCPVSTDIFNEKGKIVATISNGKTHIKDEELYSNIIAFSLNEMADGNNSEEYGTVVFAPENYQIVVTALEDCDVIIQQNLADDLTGLKLLNDNWTSHNKKLQHGEKLEINDILSSNEKNTLTKYIIFGILGFSILIFIVFVSIIISKKRKY